MSWSIRAFAISTTFIHVKRRQRVSGDINKRSAEAGKRNRHLGKKDRRKSAVKATDYLFYQRETGDEAVSMDVALFDQANA